MNTDSLQKRLLVILLVTLWGTGFTQPRLEKHFSYHHYTTYDGLSQSQVTHLYQCSKGYLWICTKDGVNRFDGKNFKAFRSAGKGRLLNHVNKIFEYNGLYYFMTQSEMTKYKGAELNLIETIPYPIGIYCGHYDESFLNNDTLFLFNCQRKARKEYPHLMIDLQKDHFDTLSTEIQVKYVHQNMDGKYLIGHKNYYSLKGSELSKPISINADNHAYAGFSNNQFIACAHYGDKYQIQLLSFNNGELKKEIFYEPLIEMSNWLNQSFISSSDHSKIFYLDKDKLYHCIANGIDKGLFPIDIPTSSIEDRDRNQWFGAEDGVYNTYHQLFEEYRFNIGKGIDNVWTILQDDNGTMWFSGYETGIWKMNKYGKIEIITPESLSLDENSSRNFYAQYMAGCKDKNGNMFFPYSGRVLVINGNESVNIILGNHTSLFLFNDEKNNRILSLGTNTQCQISKNDWKITPISGESKIIVSCIEMKNGNYLLGSYHGQYIYDNEKIIALPDTFQYRGVISMVTDSLHNIWKGTTNGLFLSTTNGEQQIAPKQFANQNIGSVFLYKNLLFAGAGRSLYLLDIEKFYNNGDQRVKVFNQHNGFVAMDDAQNGFFLDRDSFLWYPAADKVIRFKPEELAATPFPTIPTPFIVSVSATNRANQHLTFCEPDSTVHLSKNTNALRFDFFASAFNHPDEVSYRYKLSAYDMNWSDPSTEPVAVFNNLKYGSYQMALQSTIDNENWSPITYSAQYVIAPYWWQHWYAKLGFALFTLILLSYIIVTIVKLRQKKIIQKLNEQRRLNELRLQSVRSKHIPHFSGNALANIEHYIFSSDLRQANKFLSKYSKLMNITLRDAEKASRSIKQEIEYVTLYLELEKMRFQDKVEFAFDIDSTVDLDAHIPNMLLHTWVENAVKHGIRHLNGIGKINIIIFQNQLNLHIVVADNGVGRKKAHELGTHGSGSGLSILKEQLEIYNHFNVNKSKMLVTDIGDENGDCGGTQFELILPKGYKFEN